MSKFSDPTYRLTQAFLKGHLFSPRVHSCVIWENLGCPLREPRLPSRIALVGLLYLDTNSGLVANIFPILILKVV